MHIEDFECVNEQQEDAAEGIQQSAFQNPIWADMVHDLTPKIRFTTDASEAEAAAEADHSNPLDLPDTVFYVEPKESDAERPSSSATTEGYSFQNDSFGIDVRTFQKDTAATSGEYAGPSPDSISLQLESDVQHLTFAQEQLAEAIERGTGVMQAMQNVESAQAVVDARMKLYNESIAFRPPEVTATQGAPEADGDSAAQAEDVGGKARLGSVSHAQWELEKAYDSGNQIAIDNAKRNLAHEKAKEEAEK